MPCTGHPCGVPPPLRGGSPSRISRPPKGASCPPFAPYGLDQPPSGWTPAWGLAPYAAGAGGGLRPSPAPRLRLSGFRRRQGPGFALKSSPVQTRFARLAAASGFTLDPSSTQKPCRLTYAPRRRGLGRGARMPAAPVFRPVARFFRPHPCRAMPEGQKTRLTPSFWPLLP